MRSLAGIEEVRGGSFEELPDHIKDGNLVLDVGGGIKPLSRANYVLDFLRWEDQPQGEIYFEKVWPVPCFSKDTWIVWDLCSHEPWPFREKQFDFAVCKQTLEDLRDPVWVCHEMMRVARSGYIEVPGRVVESMPGIERTRYCGYSHHHWLCDVTDAGIEFTFKHAQLHGYSRFHVTVGPAWHRSFRDHHWSEAFDWVQRLLAMVNRWLRQVNPRYQAVGFFWREALRRGSESSWTRAMWRRTSWRLKNDAASSTISGCGSGDGSG